jgi:hypothetical protein
MFKLPGQETKIRIDVPVSNVGTAATLLELMEVAHDPTLFSVTSLEPFWADSAQSQEQPVYFAQNTKFADRVGVVWDATKKMIWNLSTGSQEVYDLSVDPHELIPAGGPEDAQQGRDLIDQYWKDSAALRKRLSLPPRGEGEETSIDEAARERLRGLGYLQ